MLCEVLIKSMKKESIFIDYFGFKNGSGICNGIYLNGIISISGIGFNELIAWNTRKNNYDLFTSVEFTPKVDDYQFFYKDNRIIPICLVKIKEIEQWLNEIHQYFDTMDNFFKLSKENAIQIGSSIIMFKITNDINSKNQYSHQMTPITIGQEIYSVNSNLSFISNSHFHHSYSKGIISNHINEHIYLIDIRGIPNSLFSLIYEDISNHPILVIITVLNTTTSYSPLIFGFSLFKLEEIISIASNNTLLHSISISFPKPIMKHNLSNEVILKSIFMLYDDYSNATCFHIGNGILITAKHFFNDRNMTNSHYTVTNQFHSFKCQKYLIPNNSFDIALLKIESAYNYIELPFIEIDSAESIIEPLTPFYSYQYSLFPQERYLNRSKLPNKTIGYISRVIQFKRKLCLYQLDACCYNGASGSPLISIKTNKLIGMIYQNISINKVQLPYISFAFSKDLLYDIYLNKDDIIRLKKLWLFFLSNEALDELLFLSLFKSKI